jgi:arylsulfatase A-like enzyme
MGVDYERAGSITDAALNALDTTPDGSFFLFLNYMDAHDPYYPPLPFRERYEGVDPTLSMHGIDWSQMQDVVRHHRALTPREQAHVTALYDAALAYLDSELDRLLRELARRKDWPQMMVVIMSDHGEAIGEHGDLAHGANLFGESVNVPLFIKPGLDPRAPPAGSELPGPVASVDIFATVLEHAGVPAPEGIDGIAWGRGRVQARSWLFRHEPAGVEDERFQRELRSVVEGDWKLVQRRPGTSSLYHLASDPGELSDLAAADPERRALLEALIDDGKPAVAPRAGTPEASGDALERLRALGYVQ